MENDALEQIGVHLDKESRLEQTDKEQPTIKEPLGHGAENDSIEELTDRGAAWRDELRKSMKNKDRMALKRHAMPMVDMHTRTHDRIQEVAQASRWRWPWTRPVAASTAPSPPAARVAPST